MLNTLNIRRKPSPFVRPARVCKESSSNSIILKAVSYVKSHRDSLSCVSVRSSNQKHRAKYIPKKALTRRAFLDRSHIYVWNWKQLLQKPCGLKGFCLNWSHPTFPGEIASRSYALSKGETS